MLTLIRLVQTDMGSRSAQSIGLEKAPLTVQESVQGIIKQVCIKNSSSSFLNGRADFFQDQRGTKVNYIW